MPKGQFGSEDAEMGGRTVPADRRLTGEDKGMAPPFKVQGNVADYGVVGQPQDSMGAELESTTYRMDRREGGDPNTVDSVRMMKSGDVI